ncbi:hypothetical protein RND61_27030, partial [Streptomyces sp. TRM76323]
AFRSLPGEVRSLQEHHRVVRRDQDPGAARHADRVVLPPQSQPSTLVELETALGLAPSPQLREEAALGTR